jgi:hypothetical protein
VAGGRICGARTRTDGHPCKLPAGHGSVHPGFGPCVRHGGNTRAHIVKAMREMAVAQTEALGKPRHTPPEIWIHEQRSRSTGHIDEFLRQVAEAETPEERRTVYELYTQERAVGLKLTQLALEHGFSDYEAVVRKWVELLIVPFAKAVAQEFSLDLADRDVYDRFNRCMVEAQTRALAHAEAEEER